jgi:hypothetical protein
VLSKYTEKMETAVLGGGSGIEGGPASNELLNEAPGTVILEDCRCNLFGTRNRLIKSH